MNELLKVLRMAAYVCALPLIATAVASAHNWINTDDPATQQQDGLEELIGQPTIAGLTVAEFAEARSHVAIVDQGGGITGRLVITTDKPGQRFGAPGLSVSLNRRGSAIAEAVSGNDGEFRFENVKAGAYTFTAKGSHAITTFGLYVFDDDQDKLPAAGTIQGDVMVAHANVEEVRRILNSDIDIIEYSYNPKRSELHVVGGANNTTLSKDGTISGRVVPLEWLEGSDRFDMTGNDVYLIDANGVAANVPVEADGTYMIEGLKAGLYDFVSFGPHGAAAFALEVLPHSSVALKPETTVTRFAGSTRVLQTGVDTVLSEPTSGGGDQPPTDFPPPPPPLGGGTGGAGADAGVGDFAGILGAVLAAWALSEGLSDDDGRLVTAPVILPPVIPPPVSPF